MTAPAEPDAERLRDRERTRARILESAQLAFSKLGYARASIRDIAAGAGITSALVVRYFGSKEQLFDQAVAEAFDLGETFAKTDRAKLGQAIAAHLFSGPQDVDLTAMMLLAASDPSVNARARHLAHARMLQPMAKLVGGPDAERRAAMILSMATGIWFYRFKLPLKPLSGRVDASFVSEVASVLQRLIDGAD